MFFLVCREQMCRRFGNIFQLQIFILKVQRFQSVMNVKSFSSYFEVLIKIFLGPDLHCIFFHNYWYTLVCE